MTRFLLLAGMLALAPAAEAGPCNCRSQGTAGTNRSFSYQSGPPGICSVAQDVGLCASNQIQIGKGWNPEAILRFRPGLGPDLAAVLREADVTLPAGDALRLAGLTPPEEYGDRLPDVLTAVLGLSLGRQPERLAEIHAALAGNAAAVAKPFADPRARATLRIGDYEAVVSYGCLEVSRGTFSARARTPFAMSPDACESSRT
jgi:hypothetical protein